MEQLSLFEDCVLNATYRSGTTEGTYNTFASKFGLSDEDMEKQTFAGKGGFVSEWKRKIRFIQQNLKRMGLVRNGSKRGEWTVTKEGREHLTFINKNHAKVYFVTKQGVAIWGHAHEVSKLFKNEIDLIITSPPYLLSKPRDYGHIGVNEKEYVDNLTELCAGWMDMLSPTGSIVLNIGTTMKPGSGYQNLCSQRLLISLEDQLGLHLVQNFTWHSPNKMPNGFWTTSAKKLCVNACEDFMWLSPNPKQAKANNQSVKVEYSQKHKKMVVDKMASKGGINIRPSGNRVDDSSMYKDNGGAIPHNVLSCSPEGSNSHYSRFCRANGLPRHSAMFSYKLPEFFIKYLTDPGDVIFDPFVGSCNAGYAAEINNRYWFGCDIVKEWLDGGRSRFARL